MLQQCEALHLRCLRIGRNARFQQFRFVPVENGRGFAFVALAHAVAVTCCSGVAFGEQHHALVRMYQSDACALCIEQHLAPRGNGLLFVLRGAQLRDFPTRPVGGGEVEWLRNREVRLLARDGRASVHVVEVHGRVGQ